MNGQGQDFARQLRTIKKRKELSSGRTSRLDQPFELRGVSLEQPRSTTGGTAGGFYYRQMGHELDAAAEARNRERKEKRMAMLGAGVGFALGGPTGAIAGGMIGGYVGGGCIIISSCTSPDSYEVNIAREYRDNILDRTTLGGYYALCEIVVPWIDKSRFVKLFFKKFLVDKMIDYFEVALNYKNKTDFTISEIVTKAFLGFCHLIGRNVDHKIWIVLHT